MWQQIFLAFLGFSSGAVISGGIIGFFIGLAIIPRYAKITHTSSHLLLYEDCLLLGAVSGNILELFSPKLPFGTGFLIIYGFFSGMFLGGWILALEEIADFLPVFSRRIHLTTGFSKIICSIALGKMLGSLLYYRFGW